MTEFYVMSGTHTTMESLRQAHPDADSYIRAVFSKPLDFGEMHKALRTAEKTAGGNKPSLLVVDDDSNVANLVAFLFSKRGWETAFYTRCDNALEAYRTRRPDAVITDYLLGGKTGVDLIKEMRKIYEGRKDQA